MQTTIKKSQGYTLTATIVVLGLLMLVGATYYYIAKTNNITAPVPIIQIKKESTPVISPTSPAMEDKLPGEQEPFPAVQLPSLDNSDPVALVAAQKLSKRPQNTALFIPQEMIRNFVVFVDNFSRGDLVTYFTPLIKPTTPFSVTTIDQKIYLNTESYERYNTYAEFIDSIDIETAIEQYHRLQPLLDEAYQEIAYPGGKFEDRIYDAIDLLRNVPIIDRPIELIAPSVMYKYADPQLEALDDAQKLLIRMGPDNTLKIQEKLEQLQAALMAL